MTWRKREIMDMARESWLDVYGLGHDRNSFVKALQDFEKLVREEQQTEVQRLIALVRAKQITIDKLEMALAQPAPVQEPSIPEGWERRTVFGFDALVEALDYAERKGFMPDYITSAWEGFNYMTDEGGNT